MLSRFLVLLALYVVVMFAGNAHFRTDDVRLTGLHVRTLVAALQMTIVSGLLAVYTIFMFFIRVVKQERTSFVLVSSAQVERSTPADRDAGEHDVELADPPDPASEATTKAASSCPGLAAGAEDFNSLRLDARSEGLSVVSDPLPLHIVFESSVNLDLYFLYVTFVGLILWSTFVSFNFATQDSNFVIVFGLVTGWITNWFSRECHCHQPREEVPRGEKLRHICYTSMSLIIMALGCANWRVVVRVEDALRVYLPAYVSGFFWTALAPEIAFTGVQNLHVTKGILYDARRSLPTFMLMTTVSALSCAPDTFESVFEYIANLSRMATLHLLLLEPVLIFVSIYVMIIALERQRATDLAISLVLVQGLYIAYRREMYDATVITTIVASVLLFGAHAGHLLRA